MKRIALIGLLLTSSALAQTTGQDTSYRSGDRMAGSVGTSPQGQAIIPKIQMTDASGNPVSNGGTPTGTAGNPNAAVVTVQGISGGTPQNVTSVAGAVATSANQTNGSQITQTIGNVASGTTDTGAPVKIGGVASTNFATNTSGASGTRRNVTTNPYGMIGVTSLASAYNGSQGVTSFNIITSSVNAGLNDIGNYSFPAGAGLMYDVGTGFYGPVLGNVGGALVITKGAPNLASGQVNVGTTATLVVAARQATASTVARSRLVITQSAAGPCYYGPTNTVSATTGSRLTVAGASKTYTYAGALYGICPGGAVAVDVDEEY